LLCVVEHHSTGLRLGQLLNTCQFSLVCGVQPGQRSYPLRPELIESTYMLYKATRDPMYLDCGRDILASLQNLARCPCGYCHIVDVESHEQDDHMESFFLAETVKYLWLLFDLGAGGESIVENGPYP
jgi:mannosidase alpha-like ER degradation enhancer 2